MSAWEPFKQIVLRAQPLMSTKYIQQPNFMLGRKLLEGRVKVEFMARQTWLVTSVKDSFSSLNPPPLVLVLLTLISWLKINNFVHKLTCIVKSIHTWRTNVFLAWAWRTLIFLFKILFNFSSTLFYNLFNLTSNRSMLNKIYF